MVRTSTHWSIEDYHRMIDSGLLAGRQVELIDGQVLDMNPATISAIPVQMIFTG